VVGADGGGGLEVGDGAADAEDAVVGACAEAEAVHGQFHDLAALVGELAMLARELAAHLGVAMHAGLTHEAGGLYGPRGHHTLADGGAALGMPLLVQLADGYGGDLDVYVIPKMEKEGQTSCWITFHYFTATS